MLRAPCRASLQRNAGVPICDRHAASLHSTPVSQAARTAHSGRRTLRNDVCGPVSAAAAASPAEALPDESKTSFGQAVFSVLNILMGVGLLSIPVALVKAGWFGLIVLWVLGIVTNYTGKALVRCSNTVAKETAVGTGQVVKYEAIAGHAFGPLAQAFVSAVMYTELIGTCALLLILESDNLWNLLGTQIASNPANCIFVAALLVVPTVWAPNVKSLSILGFFGFAATLTVTSVVAFTLFTGNFAAGAATVAVSWGTLPLVFGIMAFVYAGHSVFPSIQASMAEPERFPAVLDTAYLTVGTICTFLGAAGYYMYGSGALDVITFNLPGGALKTLCACLILVNPMAKFALTMEPVSSTVRGAIAERSGTAPSYALRFVVNSVMAAGIVAMARFVPYLALVMSLIGSFMTIAVSVIFPALANYKLHKGDMSTAEKGWIAFVVLLGCACAASGTAASVIGLQAKL